MTSMLDSDIDQFIQNQKAKLQQERQLIADDERGERVGRRQWDGPDRETQYAEQNVNVNVLRSPELRVPLSSDSNDSQQRNQYNRKRSSPRLNYSPRKTTPVRSPRYSPRKGTGSSSRFRRQTDTPESVISQIGLNEEEKRRRLKEERILEYHAYQNQLLPRKTIVVRSPSPPNVLSIDANDVKEAEMELRRDRQKDYEQYLRSRHTDLIPLLRSPAYQAPSNRRFIRRSPAIHPPLSPKFSFEHFKDKARQRTNDYLASQPEIDYQEWEKAFQKEKQKDYNEYLEKKKHKLRKQPTPPGSGLKFGEYEEYRKRMDRQRKQDYRQDLEKQRKEQLVLKAERDFNGIQFLQTSPRYPPAVKDKQEQKINEQIQTQKQREFDKMMALDKARDKKVPPRREEPRPRENRPVERLELDQVPLRREETRPTQNRPVERLDLDQVPLRREETRPTQNGPVERLDLGREDRPPIPQNPKLEAQVEKISDPNNYRDTFNYERHHQQLREERQKETRKFFQEKSQPQTQRTNEQDKPETGLGLGKYQEKRKLLDEERKREYNEMLAKQARKGKKTKAAQIREEQEAQYRAPQARDRSPRDYSPVQYNGTEYLSPRQPAQTHLDSTRRLQEEKENEYYDLVNKLQEGRDDNAERPRNRQEPPSLYTNGEKEALTMLEEKEREYQQLLREKQREIDDLKKSDTLRIKSDVKQASKYEPFEAEIDRRSPPLYLLSESHMDEVERKLDQFKKVIKSGETTVDQTESLLNDIGKQLEHVQKFLSPTWLVPTSIQRRFLKLLKVYKHQLKKLYNKEHSDERQEREKEREREPTSNREKLPPKPPTPGGLFNKLGAHDREREKLNEERKEEYNKLLNEQAESLYEVADTYRAMMYDEYDFQHNQALLGLIKGVQSDIKANTEGDSKGRRRDPREPIEPEPRQSRPAERQSRPEQRQSRPEQRQSRPEQRGRPASEEGASLKGLNPRDSAELRKKQLRNDEYNEYLRQKSERSNRQAGRPPLPSSAKNQRHRYEDNEAQPRRINSASNQRDGGKKEDIYATLPGLHYNGSAEQRKKAQRNREYNEMVAQKEGRQHSHSRSDGPPDIRRGWQSPSYDDILDKKRQEEAQYRREDPNGMRAYNSEPAIDTLGNDRYKELDRDYDTRKVRFRDQRSNILDNDRWLDSDQVRRDAEYQDLQQQPPPAAPRGPPPRGDQQAPQAEMATSYFATLPVGGNERDSAKRRRQDKYREELQFQMQEALAAKRREKVEDLRVNASGFLDPEKTSHRFTNLGNPDITPRQNLRSPEVQAYHTKFDLSPRGGQGRQQVSFDEPTRGRERGRAPRRDRGGGGGGGGGGLLDGGFDGLLEGRPRQAYLPPGLEYTPSFADPSTPGRNGYQSTYITGAGGALSNPALSSIDEAYHFYAMKNPLEPDNNGTGGSFDLPLNRLDEPSYRGRGSPPRVTFDDNTRARSRSRERISPYQFPSDDDFRSKSRQDQKSYQNELERQIQEKRYREQREKEERDRYDKKLEEEIRNYNPFGRGGGGAPIKDNYGNAVTDLRSMHMDNVSGTPRDLPARESPRFRAPGDVKDDLIKPPPAQINAKGENTYARGGHGIFGQPRTDAEKDTADKYKDDLRRQIEEKKRQEQIEREKEKIEEEKENRRLEEQRLRIQQEYEEEQRKKREKEEDARRKNEELRQQAEDRKKEEERKKREVADARSREKREQEERERAERQREERGSSPPIPALRSKMATDNGEPSKGKRNKAPPRQRGPSNAKSPKNQSRDYGYGHFRTGSVSLMSPNSNIRISPAAGPSTSEGGVKSPPVPSHRNQQTPEAGPAPQPLARANSSDVLKELATMRKQLQTERKRVENALENQRQMNALFDEVEKSLEESHYLDLLQAFNEPDVFDPRMVQRPQPREVDVFERAKQGHAAVPQRQTDTANPKTLQEFNELKYKTDTDSRRAFRSMFPDAPTSNSALESQQDALLRHQEDTIQNLRTKAPAHKSIEEEPEDYTPSGRQGTMSPKSMLNSNSAFIDAEGINHFPEDFEDLPKRNESARMRRRERIPVSPRPESLGINPMGSTTSLDVDRIQKKNDARLRRLHQMNTDDVSIADPDDILDRFMAKQRYNRPPSGQTLQDDSWLRPGSKAF